MPLKRETKASPQDTGAPSKRSPWLPRISGPRLRPRPHGHPRERTRHGRPQAQRQAPPAPFLGRAQGRHGPSSQEAASPRDAPPGLGPLAAHLRVVLLRLPLGFTGRAELKRDPTPARPEQTRRDGARRGVADVAARLPFRAGGRGPDAQAGAASPRQKQALLPGSSPRAAPRSPGFCSEDTAAGPRGWTRGRLGTSCIPGLRDPETPWLRPPNGRGASNCPPRSGSLGTWVSCPLTPEDCGSAGRLGRPTASCLARRWGHCPGGPCWVCDGALGEPEPRKPVGRALTPTCPQVLLRLPPGLWARSCSLGRAVGSVTRGQSPAFTTACVRLGNAIASHRG